MIITDPWPMIIYPFCCTLNRQTWSKLQSPKMLTRNIYILKWIYNCHLPEKCTAHIHTTYLRCDKFNNPIKNFEPLSIFSFPSLLPAIHLFIPKVLHIWMLTHLHLKYCIPSWLPLCFPLWWLSHSTPSQIPKVIINTALQIQESKRVNPCLHLLQIPH